jgi:hypothetical protein
VIQVFVSLEHGLQDRESLVVPALGLEVQHANKLVIISILDDGLICALFAQPRAVTAVDMLLDGRVATLLTGPRLILL